ncbi:hypothetical protein HBJ16_005310 [Pseudomonas sp. CES]|nr:hypothetical protein HBJ16_005310 [Pseudomonas sp. CES]
MCRCGKNVQVVQERQVAPAEPCEGVWFLQG